MMDKDFSIDSIKDDGLWDNITHHRAYYTPIKDIDYTKDLRKRNMLNAT